MFHKITDVIPNGKYKKAPDLSIFYLEITTDMKQIVDLSWLEHFWDYENLFETGVD